MLELYFGKTVMPFPRSLSNPIFVDESGRVFDVDIRYESFQNYSDISLLGISIDVGGKEDEDRET